MANYSNKGNYHYKKRTFKRRKNTQNKKSPPKIKPGKDSSLIKVFENIGVPEKKPFKPDSFQLEALEAIKDSDCLV